MNSLIKKYQLIFILTSLFIFIHNPLWADDTQPTDCETRIWRDHLRKNLFEGDDRCDKVYGRKGNDKLYGGEGK